MIAQANFMAIGSIILLILAAITKNRQFRSLVPLLYAIILTWPHMIQGEISYIVPIFSSSLLSFVILALFKRSDIVVLSNGDVVKGLLFGLLAFMFSGGRDLDAVIPLVFSLMLINSGKSFRQWVEGLEVLCVFVLYASVKASALTFVYSFLFSKLALVALFYGLWVPRFRSHIKSFSHLSILRG